MDEFTKIILIVDDEEVVRQSLVDYFEDNLWEVLQAESGEQALEILISSKPHAAIVDIRLGGMDGNEFIRQANIISDKIYYLICTGSPEYLIPDFLTGLPNVAQKIFKKPVANIDELENYILEHLNKKEQ